MKPKMHLAFDLSKTHLEGRWHQPGSWPGATFPDFTMFENVVKIAERGKLDMLFIADTIGTPGSDDREQLSFTSKIDRFEPLTVLTALSQVT